MKTRHCTVSQSCCVGVAKRNILSHGDPEKAWRKRKLRPSWGWNFKKQTNKPLLYFFLPITNHCNSFQPLWPSSARERETKEKKQMETCWIWTQFSDSSDNLALISSDNELVSRWWSPVASAKGIKQQRGACSTSTSTHSPCCNQTWERFLCRIQSHVTSRLPASPLYSSFLFQSHY